MVANINTMFSAREVPWHGLGVITKDALSAEEAIKTAGLDWEVNKMPIICNDRTVPDRFGLVREDTGDTLGICSQRYEIIQNVEAFDFIQDIIGENLQFETAGCLGRGETIWMTTKYNEDWSIKGDNQIGDDKIDMFLLLSNGHTAADCLRVAVTPIRVVCQNTLTAALKQAKNKWSIKHYTTMKDKITEAQRTLGLASTYMDNFVEFGNKMLDKVFSENAFEKLVEQLFPEPEDKELTKRSRSIREHKFNALEYCYNMSDLLPYHKTAWGLINAVSDYESHKRQNQQTLMSRILNADMPLLSKAIELVQSM